MVRKLALVVASAVLAGSLAGCVKLVVKHSALQPSSDKLGAVSLTVTNSRDKDRGGDNVKMVGRVRNLYGMPIKTEAENDIFAAIKVAHTDALASAGYQVVDGAPTQVIVDVKDFFMDGYMGYKIDFSASIKTVGGATPFETNLTDSHGFAFKKLDDMNVAYETFMNVLTGKAVEIYRSSEFKASVK